MVTKRTEILLTGVYCEGPVLGRILCDCPGVVEAYVNPATDTAYIDYDPERVGPERLLQVVKGLGYRAELKDRAAKESEGTHA